MQSDSDREMILDFVDGTLSKDGRTELLRRMQEDPALRREVETLQALARAVEKLPEETPPAGFAAEFMAAHGRPSWLSRIQALFTAPSFGPGLVLAGGLACALFLFRPGAGGGAGGGDLPLAGCALELAKGGAVVNGKALGGPRLDLRLEDRIVAGEDFEGQLAYADGTKVKIKAGTELQIRNRGLSLKEGGVWCTVTKDLRGFTVETPLALAAVKGTRFGVEAGPDGTTVQVAEGRVEVSTAKESKLLTVGMGAKVLKDFLVSLFTWEPDKHPMFQDAAGEGFTVGRSGP